MVKVLLTGMSGVRKSTVLNQLREEGQLTVDLDLGDWIIMNEETKNQTLFLAGTETNQSDIYPYLDYVMTLTAPLDVMKERIQARETNPFGKSQEEGAKVVEDTKRFEHLIMKSSDAVISTDKPLYEVIKEIFKVIGF